MKDYHINIFYSEKDESYIADIPDLKYCSAFGETPALALEEVEMAKQARSQSYPIDAHLSPFYFELKYRLAESWEICKRLG